MKIDHINLTVKNLERSILFYTKIFGLKILESGTNNDNPWVIIGDSDKFFLSLNEANDELSATCRINHFGISIDKFDDFLPKLKHLGVKINSYNGQQIINYANSRSIYIEDIDGNEIELSDKFGGGLN